jgi:hypothetical protein
MAAEKEEEEEEQADDDGDDGDEVGASGERDSAGNIRALILAKSALCIIKILVCLYV